MHRLSVRRYDPSSKEWIIPFTVEAVEELRGTVAPTVVMLHPDLERDLAKQKLDYDLARTAKEAGDAYLGVDALPFITEPWPHQRAALLAGANVPGYALFWEMGTGKTKAAIDIVRWRKGHSGLRRALVIAPNEVVYNWKREVAIHAKEDALILEGALKDRADRLRGGRLPTFTIMNIEAVDPLLEPLLRVGFDMVIVDESTRIKNPDAKRTKAILKLGQYSGARLILSGTPVVQHLYDLYAQLEFLAPGIFGRYSQFKYRYFTMVYDMKKDRDYIVPRKDRIEELLKVVDTLSYRVTKRDVLPDLPEKLPPQMYVVPMYGDQLRSYHRMRVAYRAWLDEQTEIKTSLVITQRLRLSQITSGFLIHPETGDAVFYDDGAKAHVVDGLVDDLLPQKIVVFAHFRAECEFYYKRYERHGSALIYGGMKPEDRDAIVNAFQTEESPKVLVCQEGSGGIGINLTAASHAIYVSRSYSLEHWLQSQDRLHRAGQKNPVTLHVVQCRGTVDQDIDDVLNGKADIAELVNRDRKEAA